MPEFIPGLQLSEIYYREAVRPILDARFPNLPHSAALVGWGSDVLGFDTPVSTDHFWGPRLRLFLLPEQMAQAPDIYEAMRQELPTSIRGYSTHFSRPDDADGGTRVREDIERGPVDPLIEFHTVDDFWQSELGVGPCAPLEPADWLTFAEQRLIEVTSGKVFHDDLGLEQARQRFAWYPRDVWLYLLAQQWEIIGQEEAFVGRTNQVGDPLGSRLVAARLVDRLARLCFLMERRYAPYSKWFGTAFQRLECYPRIGPILDGILAAPSFAERDALLARAYITAVELHNQLGITPPVEARTRTYSGWHMLRAGVEHLPLDDPRNTRPFQTVFAGRMSEPLYAAIQDEVVRALPRVGSVSQFLVESSNAMQSVEFCRKLKPSFE